MSRKCISKNSIVLSLLFFVFHLLAYTQDTLHYNPRFFAHLEKEKLHFDQLGYLNQFPDSLLADSLKIKKAELYHFLADDEKCKKYTLSLKPSGLSESSGRILLGLVLKNNMDSLLSQDQALFSSPYYTEIFKNELKFARHISTYGLLKKNVDDNLPEIPEGRVSGLQKKYLAYRPPSPLVAGVLSVVPGAGKFYAGNKYQAISAFVVNALLAWQTYESYQQAGPESFRFIASGSIFAIFYTGNIWGSVTGARKQKKDFINNLKNEMADFYLADSGF